MNTAGKRLVFLRTFASRTPALIELLAPGSDGDLPAEAALTEAAALAFATDKTSDGKDVITRILSGMKDRTASLLRQATMAAILRTGEVRLQPDGVIETSSDTTMRPWLASAPVIRASAGTLLAAALASGSPPGNLNLLRSSASLSDLVRLAQLAVATCAEAAVLPLFGVAVGEDGLLTGDGVSEHDEMAAFASFLALHDRYAAAIRLNRADRVRWKHLTCRAPLIDWPLLLLHLALLRKNSARYKLDEDRRDLGGKLAIFLRDLAGEIDSGSSGGGRDSPGGGPVPYGSGWQVQSGYQVQESAYAVQRQRSR